MRVIRKGDFFTFEPYTLENHLKYEPCNAECFLEAVNDDVQLFLYLPILRFLEQEAIHKLIIPFHTAGSSVLIKRIRDFYTNEEVWSIHVTKVEATSFYQTHTQIQLLENGDDARVCRFFVLDGEDVRRNYEAASEWINNIASNEGLEVRLEYAPPTDGNSQAVSAILRMYLHPYVGGHFLRKPSEDYTAAHQELPPTVRKPKPYTYEVRKESEKRRAELQENNKREMEAAHNEVVHKLRRKSTS